MASSRRLGCLVKGLPLAVLCFLALYAIPPSFVYDGPEWAARNRLASFLPLPEGRGPLPEGGGDLRISGAMLVDGTGAAPRGPVTITARGGLITAIEAADAERAEGEDGDLRTVDAAGAYVMPGLIDGHVHIGMAPAGAVRLDTAEVTRRLRQHHLRAYLANGVTTIFDPAVDSNVARFVQRYAAQGFPSPRYFHLGPVAANEHGYTTEIFAPGLVTRGDVEARLSEIQGSGAIGVKMAFETGGMMGDIWKPIPDELATDIQEVAAERGLPLYIHCMIGPNCEKAVKLKPRTLVHIPDTVSDELLQTLTADRPFMVSTLARWDMYRLGTKPELLEQPLWKLTVPEEARQAVLDREQIIKTNVGLYGWVLKRTPGPIVTLLGRVFSWPFMHAAVAKSLEPLLATLQATTKTLYDAGVPIVLGTDAGNHPVLPMYFHGVLVQREVELLIEAGLPPMGVIQAATLNGARMIEQEAELGTIEVGKRADLIILKSDPTKDPGAALKTLQWTILGGVAHTPEEWMQL